MASNTATIRPFRNRGKAAIASTGRSGAPRWTQTFELSSFLGRLWPGK